MTGFGVETFEGTPSASHPMLRGTERSGRETRGGGFRVGVLGFRGSGFMV